VKKGFGFGSWNRSVDITLKGGGCEGWILPRDVIRRIRRVSLRGVYPERGEKKGQNGGGDRND